MKLNSKNIEFLNFLGFHRYVQEGNWLGEFCWDNFLLAVPFIQARLWLCWMPCTIL